MGKCVPGVMVLFSILLLCSSPQARLLDSKNYTVGVRIGTTTGGNEGDFEQYELFGAYKLPWGMELSSRWQLETQAEFIAGIQEGEGERGGKFAGELDLYLFSPGRKVSFSGGIGAGVMTREEYGPVDFGGPVYFLFRTGAAYWFTPGVSLGYKYLHESNGSIYDRNPSLNMHQLELRVHF